MTELLEEGYKVMAEEHKAEMVSPVEKSKWCPQHGYPEPCAKCHGMTEEEWEKFYESLD